MKKSTPITKKKPVMRAFLLICLSLFVFGLIMTINQAAQAADSSTDMNLLEIYHDKKYKGAQDEEELKVLTDLQTSSSKKKKSQEAEEGF